MKILENENLDRWTYWKIGGPADRLAFPKTLKDLEELDSLAAKKHWPITILGGGTNVLVSDEGIRGLVIDMKEFSGVTVKKTAERLVIEALSGTPKSVVMKEFLKEKLPPALFLCGLPGDVGGGVVMNAGVGDPIHPREFVEIVDYVEVWNKQRVKKFQRDDLSWNYRHTEGWQPGIITGVGMSWPLNPDPDLGQKIKDATKSRIARQPLNLPSCGSVFANPPGLKAGALIDQSGLKGFTIGDAQVSPKHANFIVNLGNAKARDVRAVIEHVRETVNQKFGVSLKEEVRYLGSWGK